MLGILKLFQFYNKHQILKTREQHHVLVGVFLTFAICTTILGSGKYSNIITIICYVRIIDIIIHNFAVAFFDKYVIKDNELKIIEPISSYKRIFILNLLVCIELILYLFLIKNPCIIVIALMPTIVLLIKSVDKFIETRIRKELEEEKNDKV